jgi:hypothetical protein
MSMLADAQAGEGNVEEAITMIYAALSRAAAQHERECLPELLRVEVGIRSLQGARRRTERLLLEASELAAKWARPRGDCELLRPSCTTGGAP